MKWTSDYLDFEKDNLIYGIPKNELWGIVDFTSTNSRLYICNDIVNKKKGHNIVKGIMNGIMNNIVNDKEGHSIVNCKQLCL